MSKSIRCHAELLSVKDAQIVNPLGGPLAAKDRNNMPLSVGATGDRYRLEFRLEDGSLWSTIVSGTLDRGYTAGEKGILVRKGKQIRYWIPEEQEAAFLAQRKRRIRNGILIAAAAVLLLLGGWLIARPYIVGGKPVTEALQSSDGRQIEVAVRPSPGWSVTKADDETLLVETRDTRYTISLPDMISYRKAHNQLMDAAEEGTAEQRIDRSHVIWNGNFWRVESYESGTEGEHLTSFVEPGEGLISSQFMVQADSLAAGKAADVSAFLLRLSVTGK